MRLLWALLYIVTLPALATVWTEGGETFGASPQLYQSGATTLRRGAQGIAQQLSRLRTHYFPQYREKLVITFESTHDADALFFPAGRYSGAVTEVTTRDNVIAVNPRLIDDSRLWRLLGHEFFHAVHHQVAPEELDWVREGLAQKFEYDVYGGINQTNVRAAMSGSRRALEEAFDTFNVSAERYGNTFLFFQHWEHQCGTERIWEKFLRPFPGGIAGRDAINEVLAAEEGQHPDCANAQSLMTSFVIAKLTNQRREGSPRALWPQLPPMPGMGAVAVSLSQLSSADERRFFQQLPPYLGLKIPAAHWTPKNSLRTLSQTGVQFYVWDARSVRPGMSVWTGEPLPDVSLLFILVVKTR